MSRKPDSTILEIERTVLASMMLRPGDCHRVNLASECFISEQHADIFAIIQSLGAENKPVDPISIADFFEQQGRKGLAGLAVTIANEAMVTPVPEAYAHRVMTAWRQRKAREIGMSLAEATDEGAVDEAISALMNLHAIEQNHEWDAKQATQQAFAELVKIYNSAGALPGVTTGLEALDDKLGGFHAGDLIIVGGRAAMGKTALLGGMARGAAVSGVPVGVISGEQPAVQMQLRSLSALSRIESKKFRTARFEEDEWSRLTGAVATAAALPMWFLDRSAPTMAEVARVARRWKHKYGIKALYVDYLQRIVGEGERKYEQVGFVAKALKNLARDLDIPVIALAQVSRAVEGRSSQVPRMGDLSDSSEIEKESDEVLMIYREGYYNQDAPQDQARIIVEKNRHGPTGFIDVAWNGPLMMFGDQADSYEGWDAA
jgi:replicative DNA helicase